EEVLSQLRQLVEALGDSAPEGNARKIRDFYRTAMDEPKLREQGASPIAADLERAAKVQSGDELIALIGRFHVMDVGVLFASYIEQDEKISDRYAVHLHQGGLGLPERGY